MSSKIAEIREEYLKNILSKSSTSTDPFDQFKIWFDEALKAEVPEVNAMMLSTVTSENRPTARVVLLKGLENGKFIFYTNYQSDKGQQIEKNPNVALTFFWPALERQVRIEGVARKVSTEISTEYFLSRPRGSQIGAHVSPQSTPVANRTILEERALKITKKFEGKAITKPAQWGGYAVDASLFEFWQGRANRLHDRIGYSLNKKNEWDKIRLAP